MLVLLDANHRLSLDEVDDLVGGVGLLGPSVRARLDGHDGGLAAVGLLQHREEATAEPVDVDHGR